MMGAEQLSISELMNTLAQVDKSQYLSYIYKHFIDPYDDKEFLRNLVNPEAESDEMARANFLAIFPEEQRASILKMLVGTNHIFEHGFQEAIETLNVLPWEDRYYFIKTLGADIQNWVNDSIDLQQILLSLPPEDHEDFIKQINRIFIYEMITDGDDLANFLEGFEKDEAWSLLYFIYFNDQAQEIQAAANKKPFKYLIKNFSQYVRLIEAAGAEDNFSLLYFVDIKIITDLIQLVSLLEKLDKQQHKDPAAYKDNLHIFAELLPSIDLPKLTNNSIDIIWPKIAVLKKYIRFSELVDTIPNARLKLLIQDHVQLRKVLKNLPEEKIPNFLKCINNAEFYRKIIKTTADAESVLKDISAAMNKYSEYLSGVHKELKPLNQDTKSTVISMVTGEKALIKLSSIESLVEARKDELISSETRPKLSLSFARLSIVRPGARINQAPARGGAGEDRGPRRP